MADIIINPSVGKIDFFSVKGDNVTNTLKLTGNTLLVTGPLSASSISTGGGGAFVTSNQPTTNYLSKFTGNSTIANSLLFDNGSNVGIGTNKPSSSLQINSSTAGKTLLSANGTNGTLFSVVDDLSDSLMSVNNSAGLPVFEVFADDRLIGGQYGKNDWVVINNKIGIGTNNPVGKLHITGSASVPAAVFYGNVGIGTSSPATKMDIYGPVSVRGTTVLTTNFDLNAGNANDIYGNIRVLRGASLNDGMYIGYGGAGGNLKFFSNSGTTEFMTIATTGNVGIGSTSPAAKLDIVGTNTTIALSFGTTVPNNPLFINTYGSNTGIGMDQATAGLRLVGDYGGGTNPLTDIGYYTGGSVAHANWVSRFKVVNSGATIFTANVYHSIGSQRFFAGSGGTYNYLYTGTTALNILNAADTSTLVTILNGGSVGIGTTSPAQKLEVLNTANSVTYIRVNNQNSGAAAYTGVDLQSYGGGWQVRVPASTTFANSLQFSFNDAEKVRIASDGNVGIGTSSPNASLHIKPSSLGANGIILERYANTAKLVYAYEYGADGYLEVRNGSDGIVSKLSGYSSTPTYFQSNVGIGTTSPSATLTVIVTNNTGSRIQLGTISTSAFMDANKVNDFMVLTAPFNSNPASVSNGGAKWGIKMNGSVDSINTKGKAACIYAVSEETTNGYNRQVGLALHTSGFDLDNAERVRIKNDGNVGIGTTSPVAKLHILGANGSTDYVYQQWSYTSNVGVYDLILKQTVTSNVVRYNFSMNNASTAYNDVLVLDRGCIGIGTSFPLSKLDVRGTMYVNYGSNGTGYIQTNGTDSDLQITTATNLTTLLNTGTSGAMAFGAGNSERMRIISGGNVGIGTTTPGYKLHVNGNGYFSSTLQVNSNITISGGGDVIINDSDGTGTFNSFMDSGVGYIRIDDGGSANGTLNINSGTLFVGASGGNVGVSTTSPTATLQVGTNSSAVVNDNSPILRIGGSSAAARVYNLTLANTATATVNNESAMSFIVAGNYSATGIISALLRSTVNAATDLIFTNYNGSLQERMRILYDGNVGIGSTAPAYKLDVNGTGRFASDLYTNGSLVISRAGAYFYINGTNSDAEIVWQANGSNRWAMGMNVGDATENFNIYNYTTATTNFTILKANGNVGIGSTAPNDKLDVVGRVYAYRYIAVSSNASLPAYATDTSTGMFNAATNQIGFSISGTEKLRIDTNGNLGIGTTAPLQKLHVSAGNILLDNTNLIFAKDTGGTQRAVLYGRFSDNAAYLDGGTGGLYLRTNDGNTQAMYINTSGNVGIGTTSPTAKLHVNGGMVFGYGSNSTFFTGTAFDASNYLILQNNTDSYGRVGLFINAKTFNGANTPSTNDGWSLDPRSGIRFRGWLSGDTDYDTKFVIQHLLANATNAVGDLGIFAKGYSTTTPIITLTGAGLLGVGTTTPTARLDVKGGGLSVSGWSNNNSGTSGGVEIGYDGSQGIFQVYDRVNNVYKPSFWNASYLMFYISGVEKARLDTSGNLGIGTTSPSTKLHIYENANRVTYISQNNNHTARFEAYGTATAIDTTASNGIFFRINSGDIVKFAADGNVGIGTSTVDAPLHIYRASNPWIHVNGGGAFSYIQLDDGSSYGYLFKNGTSNTNNGALAGAMYTYTDSGKAFQHIHSGTPLFTILSGGNVGIGTTAPLTKLDVRGIIQGQSYPVVDTGGTGQWVKVGTLTIPQNGYTAHIRAYIHAGFNALNTQDFYLDIFFKTSNANSVDANGFAGNSWYYTNGYTTLDVTPKWVGNAAGVSATAYDLYLSLPAYTNRSHYIVEIVEGVTWTNVGSTGQTNPGNGSSTVCVSSLGFNIPIGSVGIGTISPGYKLDVNGTFNVTGTSTLAANVGIGTTNVPSPLTVYSNGDVWHFRLGGASGELRMGGQTNSGAVIQAYTPGGTVRDLYIQRDGGKVGIGTSSPNATLTAVGDGSINGYSGVIRVSDTAGTKWGGIGLPDTQTGTTAANNYYLIGRGGAYTDRVLSLHIPNTTDYGSGAQPKVGIYSTGSDLLFSTEASTGTTYVKGSLGIGSTSPAYKLDVAAVGSNSVSVRLTPGYERVRYYGFDLLGYNDGNLWMIGNNTTNALILGSNWDWDAQIAIAYTPGTYGASGGSLEIGQITKNNANFTHGNTRFYTNGIERMRIISTGNVGIGTSSPSYKLHVVQSTATSVTTAPINTSIQVDSNSHNYLSFVNTADNGTYSGITFVDNNVGGYIVFRNYTGDVTTGSDSLIYGTYQDHIFQTGTTSGVNSRNEVVRIKNNGNVGIGTNAPLQILHVNGSILLDGVSNGYTQSATRAIGYGSNGGLVSTNGFSGMDIQSVSVVGNYSQNVRFWTHHYGQASGGTPRMFIQYDGNVGIGTTSPIYKLHVVGNSYVNAGTLLIDSGNSISWGNSTQYIFGSNGVGLSFVAGSATRMFIASGGNVGIGTTSPLATLHAVSSTAGATLLRSDGTSGTLFSVVDDLTDSLMSVNNSAGLPVLEVFADDRIIGGQYGKNDFVVINNKVGIGTSNPVGKLQVTGSASVPAAVFYGSVGIGTSSPTYRLHVSSGDNSVGYFGPNATWGAYLAVGAGGSKIGTGIAHVITTDGNLHLDCATSKATYINYYSTTNTYINPQGGSIGIGTSTLDSSCVATFKAGNTSRVSITDGTTRANFWPTGGAFYISTETASDMVIITNATERIRIQSGGNVGIGTSSPGQKLDVYGSMAATIYYDRDNGSYYVDPASTSNLVGLTVANTITGAITGNAGTATNLSTNRTNWSTNGTITAVVGQLCWKHYGNNHTIIDASNSTSPAGGSINNTNPDVAWSATYPTLMGWNGGNTYGVRVDSARYADQVGYSPSRTDSTAYPVLWGAGTSYTVAYSCAAVTIQSSTGTLNATAVSATNVTVSGKLVQNSTTQSITGTGQTLTLNVAAASTHIISMASGATITTISYTNRDNNPSVNTIMLVVKYAGTASITFTNVLWANGTAPTLTGTNGYADVFMLTSYQGGAGTPVWIGTVVSQALVSTNL